MDLKETDILGKDIDNHWYYKSKAKALLQLISGNIASVMDVGAGSGFFSKYLLINTSVQEAWCVDISYKEDSDAVEQDKPIHYRRSIDPMNVDLVILMDVLEHVDDDVALLQEYVAKVPLGTRFLISVPAFEFLWSDHDVFLEHKRRYTLTQMESVVKSAGLTVTHGAYYFGAVFPIAAGIRLLQNLFRKKASHPKSQLKRHHPIINSLLTVICYSELILMRRNRVAGLTVFCLAEKTKLNVT
jgi:SAM-dependent methyltransferase